MRSTTLQKTVHNDPDINLGQKMRKVWHLIASGQSNQEIARQFETTVNYSELLTRRLFDKLDLVGMGSPRVKATNLYWQKYGDPCPKN